MRPLLRLVPVVLALAATSCGEPASSGRGATWAPVDGEALTAARRAQRAKADDARQALMGRLMARLGEALGAGGPAGAVAVCRSEAHVVAAAVAREKAVAIGRTSHRLRSPLNAPPDWARPYVEERRATPVVVAHPDGRLGVLEPIRLKAACLACHGERATIAPDVQAALARDYPRDEATGFREGDLRGWVWVEVP